MKHLNLKSAILGAAALACGAWASAQVTSTFSNTATINIPGTGTAAGVANPYPSPIAVSGLPVGVTNIAVTLNGMNHTWTDDIDVILVAPNGASVILLSDRGSSADLVNTTLTFIDGFPLVQTTSTPSVVPSGTYRPSNTSTGDNWPAPGPGTVNQATPTLASLNGIDPNGTWNLFIYDDAGGDIGNVSGGWSITISAGAACGQPTSLAVSSVTTNSAVVSWGGTQTGTYAIEYGPAGFIPGTGTLVTSATQSVTLTGLASGASFDVRVAQVCGTQASTVAGPVSFNTLIANDDPCGAFPLSVGSTCVLTGTTTVGANQSSQAIPSCPLTTSVDDDVWFSFVAPASGAVALSSVAGSASDLVATIYAGSCNGTLTEIACDDDSGPGFMPALLVSGLTPGQTYYIRWATFGTSTRGTSSICLTEPQPCGGTLTLSSNVGCGPSSTFTASYSSSSTNPTYQLQEEVPVGSNNWVNVGFSTTASSQSVTVSSVGPRNYRVAVSGSDCIGSVSNTASYLQDNPAAPTANNVTRCGAGSVTLTASNATNKFRWYDAASGGTLLSSAPTYTFNATATTTIYVASFNPASGCEGSVRTPILVTVHPLPVVTASGPAESCDNSCFTLNASGSVSGNSTLTFSKAPNLAIIDVGTINSSILVSGVNPSTLSAASIANVTINLTHTFTADLDISLIAPSGDIIDLTSDNGGSGDNYTNTVFQTGAPSITTGSAPFTGTFSPEQAFSLLSGNANGSWTLRIADQASLDVGTLLSWSITLNNQVSNPVTYSWSGPGLQSNSGASVSACPSLGNSSAQTVTYTVTATDASTGCSSTADVNVQINPLPTVSISKPASPASNNGADIVLCYGPSSVTLTAAGAGGTAGYTYQWSNGATGATNTVSPTATTSYSVTVTDSKGCTATNTISVCVINACCGNNNNKVNVCHVPPGNPGNAHNICIAVPAVAAHIAQGSYLGACGASACGSNKGGEAVAEAAAAVTEHGAFPNPANGATTIRFTLAESAHATVQVYNATGALVAKLFAGNVEAGESHSVRFDANDMPSGIYMYRINTGTQVLDGKIILNK